MNDEERIEALARYLEVEPETIKEGYTDNVFYTEDGDEYFVLTEDEALQVAHDEIESLIDDLGIGVFSKDFVNTIIYNEWVDTEWFDEARDESNRSYVDDIEYEDDNTYGNRLIAELYDEGIIDDSDFEENEDGSVNYLEFKGDIEDAKYRYVEKLNRRDSSSVDWYINNFGEDELSDIITRHNLLDYEKVIDAVIEEDGVANSIATYDGKELELENGLYAYRVG